MGTIVRARSLGLPLACILAACASAPETVTLPMPAVASPTPTGEGAPWLTPQRAVHEEVAQDAPSIIVPQRVHRYSDDLITMQLPDGLAVLDPSGLFAFHDPAGGVRIAQRLAASTSVRGNIVARSANGRRLLVAAGSEQGDAGVFLVLLDTDRVVPLLTPPGSEPYAEAGSLTLSRVALSYALEEEMSMRIHDATGALVCTATLENDPETIIFTDDATKVFVHYDGGRLVTFDASTCRELASTENPVASLVARPTGGQLLTLEDTDLVVRSSSDGSVIDRRPRPAGATRIAYSADGGCFALYSTSDVTVLRASDGRVLHATRALGRTFRSLADDCDHVAISGPRGREVLDLVTGETTPESRGESASAEAPSFEPGGFRSVWSVALDPAQSRAFIGTRNEGVLVTPTSGARQCDQGVRLITTTNGHVVTIGDNRTLCDLTDGARSEYGAYLLNDPGTHVLRGPRASDESDEDAETGDDSRGFTVQSLASGTRGRPLAGITELSELGSDEGGTDAEISDDGRYVLITRYDEGLRVFDTRSGRAIAHIEEDENDYVGGTFVANTGKVVVSLRNETFMMSLPRGPRRVLATGGGYRGITGSFVAVRTEESETPGVTFIDARTDARQVVAGERVSILEGGLAVSIREGDFDFVWLETARTQRFAGRFVSVAKNGAVLLRCVNDELRVHGLLRPIAEDVEGAPRGACPSDRARIALREDGKVLVERAIAETILTRLDDGTRIRIRVLSMENEVLVYAVDDDEGAFIVSGSPELLRRRARGPAFSAALVAYAPSEETARRLRRVLEL